MLEDLDEPDPQQIRDSGHLDLLGVFNFVFAGLCLLFLLPTIPVIQLMRAGTFERSVEDAWREMERQGSPVPFSTEQFIAWSHAILLAWIVLFAFAAVLCIVNGLHLRAHRHRGFSIMMAALQCVAIPVGTILGVFSLIVLERASVAELYHMAEETSDPFATHARNESGGSIDR